MMKEQKILPSGFLEVSVEQIIHHYNRSPKIIYLSVLILFVIGFVSLFFIKVDISVMAHGVLKAPGERIYPKASGSGYVQYINPLIKENVLVTAGDTLIIIGRDAWDEQLLNATQRIDELNRLLADLNELTSLSFKDIGDVYHEITTFQTALFRQNYQLFCRRYQNSVEQYLAMQKDYERNKLLYDKQVIASADFEQITYQYNKSVSELSTLYNEQMNFWRQEEQRYRDEQVDIQSKITQLTLQKQELTVISPVTGTIQQLTGLKVGSYITEGEVLMEISPEGVLYAECWVTPRDIGLIRLGQQTVLQIDAFNYNEWGMLKAQVVDIASDVVFLEGQPFFKVFCMPEKVYMKLKNGYIGTIKKGMTFTIRFMVTRRTLFQWLYDKMDHWLNPNNPSNV